MGFLIPLTCFPDIRLLSIVHSDEPVSVEVNDRYERQSLRNRYSICGSQGRLDLSIPVTLDDSRMYATAQIAYREAWARTHWRSITACYNNAPYFVYYADAVESLFLSSEITMQNFNLKALQFFCDVWRMKMPEQTKQWEAAENRMDLRAWAEPKSNLNAHFVNYNQVFEDKTGFIPACSGLDLLFNYGPDANEYLYKQFEKIQMDFSV
jgi:hypothetical protein